jgi:fatty acid desaturase
VEANNLCVRTLIFDSFLLLSFVKFFSLFIFWLSVLLHSLLFWFGFLSPFFSPFLFYLILSLFVFLAHVVSSLAYPNLHENKMLDCCCCCCSASNNQCHSRSQCIFSHLDINMKSFHHSFPQLLVKSEVLPANWEITIFGETFQIAFISFFM